MGPALPSLSGVFFAPGVFSAPPSVSAALPEGSLSVRGEGGGGGRPARAGRDRPAVGFGLARVVHQRDGRAGHREHGHGGRRGQQDTPVATRRAGGRHGGRVAGRPLGGRRRSRRGDERLRAGCRTAALNGAGDALGGRAGRPRGLAGGGGPDPPVRRGLGLARGAHGRLSRRGRQGPFRRLRRGLRRRPGPGRCSRNAGDALGPTCRSRRTPQGRRGTVRPGRGPVRHRPQQLARLLGPRPGLGPLVQQTLEDGAERTGAVGLGERFADDRGERGERRRTAERRGALDGREQSGAQRPDVGGRSRVGALGALGGHVVQGTYEMTGAGQAGGRAVARVLHGGDAEVGEQDAPGAVEQDVAGLDVPVQYAGLVGRRQGVHDLGADPGRLPRIEGALLAQHLVQGGALDQLHDDQGASVDLGHVVHRDDSGMADPGRRAGLALHPQPQIGEFGAVGVGVGAQFLDGDLTAEDLVDGPPDHAHTAAPELGHDPVTPGQQPTGVVLALSVGLPRRHRCPVPVTRPCVRYRVRGRSDNSSCRWRL
ncbi:hypothetical protein RKD19_007315 [Streptomyces canus]